MTATFNFDVDDCKIALWQSAGSYGQAFDVVAINQFSVEIQTVNKDLEGDASIVDTHARGVGSRVRFKFAFRDLQVYHVLTGASVVSSGSDEAIQIDNFNPKFFGIMAQSKMTDGLGDVHIFVPKVKIQEGFQLQGQYGEYMTPEITARGVLDTTYGLIRIKQHGTAIPLVIPTSVLI